MKDKFCATCDMYPANCVCPKPYVDIYVVGDVEATIENPDASTPPKDAGAREWWITPEGITVRSKLFDGGTRVIEYAAYEKLERELAEAKYNLERLALDCGSNSCRYGKSGGMRTNGPCKCSQSIKENAQAFEQLTQERAKLADTERALKVTKHLRTEEVAKSEGLLVDGARLDLLLTKEKQKSAALVEALEQVVIHTEKYVSAPNITLLGIAREALAKWGLFDDLAK